MQEKYKSKVIPLLRERFKYANIMAVPKIEKVVVNVGVGRRNDEERKRIFEQLALITGQQPQARPAKQSIASFKTRQGQIIGYSITLRGKRMYDFIERLASVALPRTRDFRGINPKSVDSYGNLTIGIPEHIVFPEMIGVDARLIFGFEVTIVTTSGSREEARVLFEAVGIPFQKMK